MTNKVIKYLMIFLLGVSTVVSLPIELFTHVSAATKTQSGTIEIESIYSGYVSVKGKTSYRGMMSIAYKAINGVPDFKEDPTSEIKIFEDGTFHVSLTHSPNAPGASEGTEIWLAAKENLDDYLHLVVEKNPNPVTISEIQVSDQFVSGKTRPNAEVQLGTGKIMRADATGYFQFNEDISSWDISSRTLMAVIEENGHTITSERIKLSNLNGTMNGSTVGGASNIKSAAVDSNGLVSIYGVSTLQLGDKMTFKNEARQMSVTLERQGDTWDFNVTELWSSGERTTQYFGRVAQESEKTVSIERLRSEDDTSVVVSSVWDLSSGKMEFYSGKRIYF